LPDSPNPSPAKVGPLQMLLGARGGKVDDITAVVAVVA
jgi:hypothetical protein